MIIKNKSIPEFLIQAYQDKSNLSVKNIKHQKLVDFYLSQEIKREGKDLSVKLLKNHFKKKCTASIFAKQDGIIAGLEEIKYFLKKTAVKQCFFLQDSALVKKNQKILTLKGNSKLILKIERALLNFLGRLSGIATMTYTYIQKTNYQILICPTRKTLWSNLDKKAVIIGGGGSHRLNLNTAVLLKENHLNLLKNQIKDLEKIFSKKTKWDIGKFLEIEVENEDDFIVIFNLLKKINLPSHIPKIIMFDNFPPEKIKKITKKYQDKNIFFEASGGISLKNISSYKNTGVHIISSGALTHSSKHFDLSLLID